MYSRDKLNEWLNILDGNVGFMCVADDVESLTKVLQPSMEALAGAFLCNLERIEEKHGREGFHGAGN